MTVWNALSHMPNPHACPPKFFSFMPKSGSPHTGSIEEIVESVQRLNSKEFRTPDEFQTGGQWYRRAESGANKKALTKCKPPMELLNQHFKLDTPEFKPRPMLSQPAHHASAHAVA